MATVNGGAIPAERIVTIGDFVERVYLPWIEQHKRPSTAKGYRDIWEDHLRPYCSNVWLKDARTYHVQGWLDEIGKRNLSRNTLKHIKSVVSAIFTLAKQQDYFHAENPARDTAINPGAAEPQETHAYSLDEIQGILSRLPEPAGTAFAIAAFMGLRYGEIRGLQWENYPIPDKGEEDEVGLHLSREITLEVHSFLLRFRSIVDLLCSQQEVVDTFSLCFLCVAFSTGRIAVDSAGTQKAIWRG